MNLTDEELYKKIKEILNAQTDKEIDRNFLKQYPDLFEQDWEKRRNIRKDNNDLPPGTTIVRVGDETDGMTPEGKKIFRKLDKAYGY